MRCIKRTQLFIRLRRERTVSESSKQKKKADRTTASMVKVDGLWVHQGRAEPGANWERILEDVREERIESALKK